MAGGPYRTAAPAAAMSEAVTLDAAAKSSGRVYGVHAAPRNAQEHPRGSSPQTP